MPDPANMPVSSSEFVILTIERRRSGRAESKARDAPTSAGRNVAGQQGGRQLDPQTGGERFHMLLHDDAVQQVR